MSRSRFAIETAIGRDLDRLAGFTRLNGMTDAELRGILQSLRVIEQPGHCIACGCYVAKSFWVERPICVAWNLGAQSAMTETVGPYCFTHWPGRPA